MKPVWSFAIHSLNMCLNASQMPATHTAARRLVSEGKVEITQKGKVVVGTAKGPYRLRLAATSDAPPSAEKAAILQG